ncbi:unknown protein [Seminavis robusta]|uniref:Uncharacterized protein n=1 Tax=Seminavis robusta TaxID=568900 RepID=A0A9N8EG93_9STRA|nr:unknown protein [Seminavis robusta]|eukprot:Sro901_g217930.1 n/a (544) ;mRNA; r:768-2565
MLNFWLTPSSTTKRLYENVKIFLPAALEASMTEEAVATGKLTISDARKVFIRVLAALDAQVFEEVAKGKLKSKRPKMEPHHQKAMLLDASLSKHQFELVRMYTIVAIGYNPFQPVAMIKALDVEVFQPTHLTFKEGKRKKMSHYRPVDKVFKWSLDRSMKRLTEAGDLQRIEVCHIVFGADHGQGAFRAVATILLLSKGNVHKYNLALEKDFLCGFIECKKDTYEVITQSLAKPLNESIKRAGPDIVFCQDEDHNRFVEFGRRDEISQREGIIVLHAVDVESFLVGDLKFGGCSQGRDGYSTYWCLRCMLGKAEWTNSPNCLECGQPWTWQAMADQRKKAQQIVKDKKRQPRSTEVRGCVQPPIFDAIPVRNYLTPVLHNVDLFTNTIKQMIDGYVDHRLENRPMEFLQARWEEADTIIDERQAEADLECAKDIMDASKEFENAALLTEAKETFKAAEEQLKKAKAARREAAAKMRRLEKDSEYGALSQEIRQSLDEEMANLFNIHRSSWHGGAMVVNYCRKMLHGADQTVRWLRFKMSWCHG